ncbi:hypothetical protein SAMN05216376_111161 [Mameliella alba]|uniref:hypothetical protein n=1 Tax=Mameliella alba TaxID=561184 RepID=UPI00088B79CD|nr:hypothetical protein [Mameliella alba]OWV46456.1 hypothetical protein CDZ96_17740 [Mameliella alba]PTR37263.1 hypothetical protein LX94_03602 [Mameliella alba]GGF73337.1 hypothetical protein GCM10011319_37340 [Mameliella alba]SDD77646.1 hypothetical protein SAMN05216376_111161 [Mameliella alba]
MIHLSHTVSGGEIGNQLANDEEELAYALAAIALVGVDDNAVADYLSGEDRERVRTLCNAIALSLADE